MSVRTLLIGTIVCLCVSQVSLAGVIEYPLDYPEQRVREIGPLLESEHSQVDIYVENTLDPLRWKDWYVEIWVPDNAADVLTIDVDYDNTANHSDPVVYISDIPLAPITGIAPRWDGYKGFYASTFEAEWEQYGTSPEGSQEPYPIGNPAWVSFHFQVDVPEPDPFGYYIMDKCIPEPASLSLLALGAMALLRKRRAA